MPDPTPEGSWSEMTLEERAAYAGRNVADQQAVEAALGLWQPSRQTPVDPSNEGRR